MFVIYHERYGYLEKISNTTFTFLPDDLFYAQKFSTKEAAEKVMNQWWNSTQVQVKEIV